MNAPLLEVGILFFIYYNVFYRVLEAMLSLLPLTFLYVIFYLSHLWRNQELLGPS